MTLGFHYHIPAEEISGKIYLPGYLGVFIDSLSIYFDNIYLFMHTSMKNEQNLSDYELKSSNIILINIGPHEHMIKRSLFPKKYTNKIKSYLQKIDIMLIRGPSPLLPAITKLCLKSNIPFSYLLVGDYLEGLQASPNMNKIKKLILYMFYKYNKYYQDKYINNEPIFVNSKKLYLEYNEKASNCIEVKTTTLSNKDFYNREDTCKNNNFNLLYTGRIDPTKGITDIFYAVSNLKKEGSRNIIINLVGWETKKGFLKELDLLAEKLLINENYIFHGKKTVGPELFEMYRKSDMYILASKGDFEGFPRTLWEAMANSLPIIATRVGSIPHFLSNDNSVLISPNKINEIENAINILINNSEKRKILIKNAIELARTNTLEIQSLYLSTKLKEYIK